MQAFKVNTFQVDKVFEVPLGVRACIGCHTNTQTEEVLCILQIIQIMESTSGEDPLCGSCSVESKGLSPGQVAISPVFATQHADGEREG